MKKITSIILIIILSTNITACKPPKKHLTTDEQAYELSVQVTECIVNKDAEGLKELLCQGIYYTHDIEAEIQEAFEFIDGNIISYDEPKGSAGGWASREGEGVVEQRVGCETRNIKTDTGKTYYISFSAYLIYIDDTDKEGITILGIRDEDLYEQYPDNPQDYERVIGGVE